MKETVLLVDDNEDLLQITRMILSSRGYTTVLATTVQQALEQITLHRPAVILMDVCLCGEDGRELCSRLKNNDGTSNIRIILMSGDDGCLAANNTADDFLAKPFDFAELTDKVQKQFETVKAIC